MHREVATPDGGTVASGLEVFFIHRLVVVEDSKRLLFVDIPRPDTAYQTSSITEGLLYVEGTYLIAMGSGKKTRGQYVSEG